jgi:hypothetical protein
LLVGFVPVEDGAADFLVENYFERLGGALVWRVEDQR